MKKWDKIIIGVLLLISFLPYLLFKVFLLGDFNGTYAYITVEGKPYMDIPLTGQVTSKEYTIKSSIGTNVLVVENESIRVEEADCPDLLCEEFGAKNQVGDVIVCLPHQVYIEIKGTDHNNEVDGRIY